MTSKQDTLKKLQRAWGSYKEESGSSQAKAAKALGMNQSAFSQYIRGEIGANTDFLQKFEQLTGIEVDGGKQHELRSFSLSIKSTLSGLEPLVSKVLVESMVSAADCIGILVDMPSAFERGSILIADPSAEIREGDLVVLLQKTKAVLGNIRSGEDGLFLAIPSWGGTENSQLDRTSDIARVTSSFYPQRVGKVVRPM